MDIRLVLEHLRAQFKDQLVLYADDLAKILDKSEKAVQQLISRGSLPFQVKTIGGRKCVDIFQVAKWLASELDTADELAPSAQDSRSKELNTSRSSRQPGRSSIGVRLMERRHAEAARMLSLADALQDMDERAFLRSVAEKHAFPGKEGNNWGFRISCKSSSGRGQFDSSVVCADLQDALSSLRRFLRYSESADTARVEISGRRGCVFLAVRPFSDSWVTIKDDLHLQELGYHLKEYWRNHCD